MIQHFFSLDMYRVSNVIDTFTIYTPSPFSFRRFFFIPIKKHHFCFYPLSIKNDNPYEPFLFLFSLSNSNINVEVNILINLK